MNVLIVNYEFPPCGGGAAKATYFLAQCLSKNNSVGVTLLCGVDQRCGVPPPLTNTTFYPVYCQRKNIHQAGWWAMTQFVLKAQHHIQSIINRHQIDLVHYFFSVPTGLIALCSPHKIPYIISLRGGDVPGVSVGEFELMHKILKPFNLSLWKNARALVANSHDLKRAAETVCPGIRYEVIPNGVELNRFKPVPNNSPSTRPLQLLSVARLAKFKGLSFLIEAVKKTIGVELTLIGTGELENELKSQANDKIRFVGYVNNADLPQHYNNADVFVLPSLGEGMSNSMLEAMASGLPIIATDTGDAKLLVKGNGFIVEKYSAESLKKTVEHYRDNRKLITEHGRQSRIIAEKSSWEQVAELYLKIYNEVLRKTMKAPIN